MNEDQIKQLLQSRRQSAGQRGFRCPDENVLAAYLDGKLDGSDRIAFEKHTAGCQGCLDALAFLTRSAEWTNTSEVPAYVVARARSLVTQRPAITWRWRWAFATAAAACVILAVSLLFLRSRVEQPSVPQDGTLIAQSQPTPEPVAPTPITEPARPLPTRSIERPNLNRGEAPTARGNGSRSETESAVKPALLFPREDSVVRKSELELRWRPVPDAVRYEIRLITSDGGLRLVRETKELSLRLVDEELQTDKAYYLKVVAHTSDGRTIPSELVSFRLNKD